MSLNGIDIASWQAGLNAGTIPADFVIVKATGGTSYVNPYCDEHIQQALAAGKLIGVYHYAQEKGCVGTAIQEADHFIGSIKGYIGKAILVLDWEEDVKDVLWAKTFLDRVLERTGVKPLIYMSKSVTRAYNWSGVVSGDYGLWVAQYANDNATGYQDDPWTDNDGTGAFKSIAMLQYSSSGRLAGWNGNLDINKFYGDKNTWAAYAKSSTGTSPEAPKPPQPAQPGGKHKYNIGQNIRYSTIYQSSSAPNNEAIPASQMITAVGTIIRIQEGAKNPYLINNSGTDLGWVNDGDIREVLNADGSSSQQPQTKVYTIQAGDTLSGIAGKLGVTQQHLISTNGIANPNVIYAGQTLKY